MQKPLHKAYIRTLTWLEYHQPPLKIPPVVLVVYMHVAANRYIKYVTIDTTLDLNACTNTNCIQ